MTTSKKRKIMWPRRRVEEQLAERAARTSLLATSILALHVDRVNVDDTRRVLDVLSHLLVRLERSRLGSHGCNCQTVQQISSCRHVGGDPYGVLVTLVLGSVWSSLYGVRQIEAVDVRHVVVGVLVAVASSGRLEGEGDGSVESLDGGSGRELDFEWTKRLEENLLCSITQTDLEGLQECVGKLSGREGAKG